LPEICASISSRNGFLVNLPAGDLGFYQQTGVILYDVNLCAGLKSSIATCGFVVAFGISKSILLPRQQCEPRAYRVQENSGTLQAGQVQVPTEILDELPDRDVVPAP